MLELDKLADVSVELVAQSRKEITTLLQEQYPEIDLKRGALQDLLLRPHAILHAREQEGIRRYLQARSLLDVEKDPTLAEDSVVDAILSNFRLTRASGSPATGQLTVVISDNTTVTIPSGMIFTANGRDFVTPSVYTAKNSTEQITIASDRLIRSVGSGQFAFEITVVATVDGPDGLLRKDSLVIPETQPKNYVTSFVADDFTGGLAAETTTDMLSRLKVGMAADTPANRITRKRWLSNFPEFRRVGHSSLIGLGDRELSRDQHSLFPVSSGGTVDWYIRTQERVQRRTVQLTATLVSPAQGHWQITIQPHVFPGCYEVTGILPYPENGAQGTLELLEVTHDFQLPSELYTPDIQSAEEAAFSDYQVLIVLFKADGSASLPVGTTQEYSVTLAGLPLISDIQQKLLSYELRHEAADTLVKAPIPCFIHLAFTVETEAGSPQPSTLPAIQQALADKVNRIDFTGRLPGSVLADIVHNWLDDDSHLRDMVIVGRLLLPDGQTVHLQGRDILLIPDDLHPYVSGRTVQFYLEPVDVRIQTVVVSAVAG